MSLVVRKPFNSALQRFVVGKAVPADAQLAPHSLDDLQKRGFVGEEVERPAVELPAAAPAARGRRGD